MYFRNSGAPPSTTMHVCVHNMYYIIVIVSHSLAITSQSHSPCCRATCRSAAGLNWLKATGACSDCSISLIQYGVSPQEMQACITPNSDRGVSGLKPLALRNGTAVLVWTRTVHSYGYCVKLVADDSAIKLVLSHNIRHVETLRRGCGA